MLFEAYLRYSSIAASGERLWQRFAPALIVILVLLWLAQIPLAYKLARRVRGAQEERVRLLRQAMAASDLERGRIAADLHDGAVQNLAGVSYSLSAAAGDLQRGDTDSAVDAIEEAARETRRSIRDLRTLLVDIYPADLHRIGLAAALGDLVSRAGARGVHAEVDVPEDLRLPPEAEALLYRTAQEAVRNALEHADPQRLDLSVVAENGSARLEVRDDGRGFDPAAAGRPATSGCGCSPTSPATPAARSTSPPLPGRGPPCAWRCRPHDPRPAGRRPRGRPHRPRAADLRRGGPGGRGRRRRRRAGRRARRAPCAATSS